MSRLVIARALSASGIVGATVSTVCGLAGVVGVIVTTPALCPDSVSPARCSAAGSKAALIGAYGLTAAGLASCLFVVGRLVEPEA